MVLGKGVICDVCKVKSGEFFFLFRSKTRLLRCFLYNFLSNMPAYQDLHCLSFYLWLLADTPVFKKNTRARKIHCRNSGWNGWGKLIVINAYLLCQSHCRKGWFSTKEKKRKEKKRKTNINKKQNNKEKIATVTTTTTTTTTTKQMLWCSLEWVPQRWITKIDILDKKNK